MDFHGGGCDEAPEPIENPRVPAIEIKAGNVTENSAAFLLRTQDADRIAYLTCKAAGHVPLSAEEIFTSGSVEEAPAEFRTFTVSGLEAETEYVISAAARLGDAYSRPAVLTVVTSDSVPPAPPVEFPLLTFTEASKTGFTYRIQPEEENTPYFHSYIEKWAYDYLWESFDGSPDNPADVERFLTDFLADYGMEDSGTKSIIWRAGDDNPPREGFAAIVGGKGYYAIACTFDPEALVWTGTPESVEFSTKPAGESSCGIDITIENLTSDRLTTRIEPGEGINFYFYHLFQKEVVEQFIAAYGEEAFRNHIYEYGYVSREPYTDLWAVSPGTEYVIAALGVDTEGDIMYAHTDFTAPVPEPEVEVTLQPYENELEGYYRWQSLEASVKLHHFGEVGSAEGMWTLLPQEVVNAALEMLGAGATVEQCVLEGYLMLYPMDTEWTSLLSSQGSFTAYFNDLEERTEYCFIALLPDPEGNPIVSHATASTGANPGITEPEPEYLAYLGQWKVNGKSTEDWSSPMTYDITIEQLTPNLSFLVKGWSSTEIGNEMPFVMNYDPDTKKIYVRAPQTLGTRTDNGAEYEAVFSGYFVFGATDDLTPLSGTTYTAYTGYINGDYLTLLPEIFDMDGRTYSFKSMGYGGYASGEYRSFTGEEYNIIDFTTKRVGGAGASEPVRTPVSGMPAYRTVRMQAPDKSSAGIQAKQPFRNIRERYSASAAQNDFRRRIDRE